MKMQLNTLMAKSHRSGSNAISAANNIANASGEERKKASRRLFNTISTYSCLTLLFVCCETEAFAVDILKMQKRTNEARRLRNVHDLNSGMC